MFSIILFIPTQLITKIFFLENTQHMHGCMDGWMHGLRNTDIPED